jgi:hypothetical protein
MNLKLYIDFRIWPTNRVKNFKNTIFRPFFRNKPKISRKTQTLTFFAYFDIRVTVVILYTQSGPFCDFTHIWPKIWALILNRSYKSEVRKWKFSPWDLQNIPTFCRSCCGTQQVPDYKLKWTVSCIYVCMYVCGRMIIGRHKKCCLVIGYKISNITCMNRNHGRFLYIRKALKTHNRNCGIQNLGLELT